jgi:BolA family transcriptional regulator, general stress-responsive regulator
MAVKKADVEQALRAAFADADIALADDSHLHAGHAGAREGAHFSLQLTSPVFAGLSRLARHRLVYDALRSLIPRGIHALAITARTPDEAARGE